MITPMLALLGSMFVYSGLMRLGVDWGTALLLLLGSEIVAISMIIAVVSLFMGP